MTTGILYSLYLLGRNVRNRQSDPSSFPLPPRPSLVHHPYHQSFRVHTPQAWLRLDTMVVEKTDYLTGRNVRYLRVDTPDLPSSQLDASGGRVSTPPPRENGDGTFGGGSGSSGSRSEKAPVQPSLNGWAPPTTGISPDKLLFGDISSSVQATAGSNGAHKKGAVLSM